MMQQHKKDNEERAELEHKQYERKQQKDRQQAAERRKKTEDGERKNKEELSRKFPNQPGALGVRVI